MIGHFIDSPKDTRGYPELVCKGCKEWIEGHING